MSSDLLPVVLVLVLGLLSLVLAEDQRDARAVIVSESMQVRLLSERDVGSEICCLCAGTHGQTAGVRGMVRRNFCLQNGMNLWNMRDV